MVVLVRVYVYGLKLQFFPHSLHYLLKLKLYVIMAVRLVTTYVDRVIYSTVTDFPQYSI